MEEKTTQEKFETAGKKMQSIGCAMTLLLTVPIIGLVVGGPVGLVIGILIGILGFVGMVVGKKK